MQGDKKYIPDAWLDRSGHATLYYTLAVGVLFMPVVLYIALLKRYVINVPWDDDYYSVLPFLCNWLESPSMGQKLALLFQQDFCHRIVLSKCGALLNYWIFGHSNLIVLQALGWTGWVALFASVIFWVPAVRRNPLMGLPVSLLLMQPEGYTVLTLAVAWTWPWVLLLTFWAVVLSILQKKWMFTFSILIAAMAPLVFANGLLVFPVAVIGLLMLRKFRRALVFLVMGILVWFLFFHGYSNPQTPFKAIEFIGNAVAMIGSPAAVVRLPVEAAIVAGAVILLASVGVLFTPRFWQRLPTHALFLLFILLSGFMAARGRIGWGVEYMLQDRYRIYGLLAVSLLYLLALEVTPLRRRVFVAAVGVVCAGGFCFLSYATFFPAIVTGYRWCQATAMNRQLGNSFLRTSTDAWSVYCKNLKRAEALGVYRPPLLLSESDLKVVQSLGSQAERNDTGFVARPNGGVCGYLIGPSAEDTTRRLVAPSFAVIVQKGRPLILPVDVWRARLAEIVHRKSLFSDRWFLILPESCYSTGRMPLYGLVRESGGRLVVAWSGIADCR